MPRESFGALSTSGHQAGGFGLLDEMDEMKTNVVAKSCS
jgi:hypothetical protein